MKIKRLFYQIMKIVPPVFWVTLFMMICFSLVSRRYFTFHNMITIIQQCSVLLIVAAAATMIILTEGLDLSLGGVLTVSGITGVLVLNAGLGVFTAFVTGTLTGAVCGAITGLLIALYRMPPFIATLGMQGVFFGVSLALTDSKAIFTDNSFFVFLGSRAGNIPVAAIFAIVVFTILCFVFSNTPFGRYIVAIGGNETGAALSGVSVKFWKWMVYVSAGAITGLAGVLLAARLEAADPIVGKGWEFDAIAATILGGTSFQKGKGSIKGTAFGVLLITALRNGLNVIRTPSMLQPALIGTILIFAIMIQVGLSMRRK
jgi:ribose transport system permease protein